MKHKLFIDSDTYLEFSSRAKAFIYVEKHKLNKWMLLSINTPKEIKEIQDTSDDSVQIYEASVFNPFLMYKGEAGLVEWFRTEEQALKYIGGFL